MNLNFTLVNSNEENKDKISIPEIEFKSDINQRYDRTTKISLILENANRGWITDVYPFAIEWNYRFSRVPIIADGRAKTNYTRKGRGTTAFDLFRERIIQPANIKRIDFLSLKTEKIRNLEATPPSRVEISTGNLQTIEGLIAGCKSGSSFPVLIFAGIESNEGGWEPYAKVLAIDLGAVFREGVEPISDVPFKRGEAPRAYIKWSSERPCGSKGKGKARARADVDYPYEDENGRLWMAPDRVRYPELCVSLSKCGIEATDWSIIHISDLPNWVDSLPWNLWSS